ncbi:MAG: cellulase family glycosylhydrolase, partial [Chloroflexaceae bacterium]|nr:cellulase family glycosylhydrolase [Chloroflexaceae bacterium]
MITRLPLLMFLGMLFFSLSLPFDSVSAEPRCFPEAAPVINHCIDGRLRTFWEEQGGLPVFGYPLSDAYDVPADNGNITVQLFERARLEIHPHLSPPYDVQLGQLGREILVQRSGLAAPEGPREDARCQYFGDTGQSVCGPFLQAWRQYGLELGHEGISEAESLALFGLPLTPARPEVLEDGRSYTVQWFERARFEDHAEQGILFGLLGHQFNGSLPSAEPWQNPIPADPPEPGGFIEVSGSQLTRLGRPLQIKGVNYYPQGLPWTKMWENWDGPQIERELRLARDQLGVNAIRILLPYDAFGGGEVNNKLIQRMREITQIAGDLDMRLIVTLFDFYDGFPEPGTRGERRNFEYLERLIGNFAGDDRILAWDLHNEPDNYNRWANEGRIDQVMTWLVRMADKVRELAPNHLVTVGMAHYQNLWVTAPDGRSVIDISDVVSVHIYNAADAARQLDEIRARTNKPILLQEFGWPSGPPCTVPDYTEWQQAQVYRQTISAAEGRVAGIFAWTLRDYDAGPSMRWDNREEHYGLYRRDDSLKPAAFTFRDYAGPPLPSVTRMPVELTRNPAANRDGEKSAREVAGSPYHVKGWFRRAWEYLGGQGSLGLPLSEAFVRPEDGKVVQYFESAVIELD